MFDAPPPPQPEAELPASLARAHAWRRQRALEEIERLLARPRSWAELRDAVAMVRQVIARERADAARLEEQGRMGR